MSSGSDERLVNALKALSSPTRLAVMRALRTPQIISEISVRDGADGRILTRQTLRRHVDELLRNGLVQAQTTDRGRGTTLEFLVQPQQVFVVSEQLKLLASLYPTTELDLQTEPHGKGSARPPSGPTLALVKGLNEGCLYPIQPPAEGRSWRIGRRRGLEISLEYDSAVSREHARITFSRGRYLLEDVPNNLNGTSLNFHPVLKGEQIALEHGDVIGVGRSLLLFWRRRQ